MKITFALSILLLGSLALLAVEPAASTQSEREMANKAFRDGNFNDAYQTYRKLVLDPSTDARQVGSVLEMAIQCLQQLNRVDEIDELREASIAAHAENWRLLWAAARSYLNVDHHGFIVSGKFERGNRRGGGEVVQAYERDRVRALQLMRQAMPLAEKDESHGEVGEFFFACAQSLLGNRGYGEAWRLQYLTDLETLPDYEPGWGYYGPNRGAPVDEEGKPVFHKLPESFEKAQTDGERWRWCLVQAAEMSPGVADRARREWADFLWQQFGVQTMAEYGWFFGRARVDDTKEDESGTYALHTLGEDETIARLATGIKRFPLPDEFNFIKIYQELGEKAGSSERVHALSQLGQIFENRRQYPRAAEYWRKCIALDSRPHFKDRLEQIVANWGRFESIVTQPAGKGATLEFRFRNAKGVRFTAREINVEKLLADMQAYLKSNPNQLDWNRLQIENLGYRLVHQNQQEYLGAEAAAWRLDLEPREKHFDKLMTIATPLQKAGAYLLTARVDGGNTSHIIVWLANTAIAKKPLDGKTFYYVADAVSGQPVARANVEFFGWRQEQRGARRFTVLTRQFAEFTDASGQVMLAPDRQPQDYQWIVIARSQGRLAWLGFTHVWYGQYYDQEYNETKVYSITDRPVYRPDQEVNYKFWIRHARYDQPEVSDFAGQKFTVEIYDPKGDKIVQKAVKADAYGGIEGKWKAPADATLGVYQLQIENFGGGQFRIEEYKKPEYEVAVEAPTEPIMLGDKIEATIRAKYYFGSPVTKAKVKYKVERTGYTERWYPPRPWDWLYGPGYWWFASDYDWYPGWRSWGCPRPMPFWWPSRHQPPELVADREVEIGPDGTVKVEIDTAVAKAIHPDLDHQYTITAEVVDQSRRTIVGTGKVLVARKPFQVTCWMDRGYYRAGGTMRFHAAARTLDGKPVEGAGKLELFAVSYQDGKPVERSVHVMDLATNAEGKAQSLWRAARAGQYRFSYKLTDAKGHTVEGGYLFSVIGEAFQSDQFRFDALELIADKAEYQPGEKVQLLINTDRADATVLLFVRPANGIYLPPRVVRMDGKSTVQEIEVSQKDMPNFFVEAVTIADGKVHQVAKEIVVPPEKRVLTVEVEPSSESYRPGQDAKVKLKLADFEGKPFVGSTVVAIYDKSVEYISGGSNVPEIKEFFWKWRRHHHPQTEHNLQRGSGNIVPPNEKGMSDLGAFGATVALELSSMRMDGAVRMGGMGGFGGGVMQRRGGAVRSYAATEGASMAADAKEMLAPAPAVSAAAGQPMLAMNAKAEAGAPGQPLVQPTVRTEFADTALWAGALETSADGTAEVALKMPENLTTWRIKVWGMGHGTKVGEGATDVVTRKDLIIRLQAPRFFIERDEVVLSANVHNYLKSAKNVEVALELDGGTIEPMGELVQRVEIASEDEARIDWRVKVIKEGEAVIRMKALTDEESDAMEMRFPCYVHGMLKMDSYSGAIPPDGQSGKFTVGVPEERRPDQTRLEVRYSPTLAGAMVDALPYLANYPYGCTEQTLNRFLPTVITQRVLIDMGLDLKAIQEKQTNLNAQELGEAGQRAAQWKRYDRNPVFDQEEVTRMVKAGLDRLTEMQLSDGGWGWFSGYGEHSTAHMTALVVHGLQITQHNDVAIVPGVMEKGVEWLKRYQAEQIQWLKNFETKPKDKPWKEFADNLDALTYMVLVDAGAKNDEMRDFLYRDRTRLAVYGMAMYGLALEKQAEREKLDMILRNISQYVEQDDENQTAWLKLPETWWYWWGSEYEAHSYYLKLLARTEPKGELARRLVKYLLNNRKHATYWNSTRDTALAIEALADFLRASGEDKPEMTVEVWLDGQLAQAVEITPATLFQFDNSFVIEGEKLAAGEHVLELKKRGTGPLYYNGYLTNFTLEDMITKAGLEIKVERKYFRLNPVDAEVKVAGSRGQVVDQKVEKYEREELPNLASVASGQLVEIELSIESKNDYEYLVFEDMKPAGFEPVELQSGYTGNALGAYVEFRDNRVAFFTRMLARGNHSVAYRMRAEIPGRFSALPAKGWAMYAPELKANSDEIKLQVED